AGAGPSGARLPQLEDLGFEWHASELVAVDDETAWEPACPMQVGEREETRRISVWSRSRRDERAVHDGHIRRPVGGDESTTWGGVLFDHLLEGDRRRTKVRTVRVVVPPTVTNDDRRSVGVIVLFRMSRRD